MSRAKKSGTGSSASASSSGSGPVDASLELARAVAELTKKGTHFEDAVKACNTLIQDQLNDY